MKLTCVKNTHYYKETEHLRERPELVIDDLYECTIKDDNYYKVRSGDDFNYYPQFCFVK